MKLYQVHYIDPDHGTCYEWFGQKRAACKRSLEITDQYNGEVTVTVGLTEIPTDKAGLVEWLNHHFNTDNG